MTALWLRAWFPAVPGRRLAVFRLLVAAFAAVDVLVASYVRRYGAVAEEFHDPLLVLRPLGGWRPGVAALTVLCVVLVVALVAAAVGYRTRVALALAAPLYTYWWSLYNSFGKVNHGKVAVVVALWALLLAALLLRPRQWEWSVDARRAVGRGRGVGVGVDDELAARVAGWALRLVAVAVVLTYVLSVVAKMRVSGPGWAVGTALQSALLPEPGPLVGWFLEHPAVLVPLQVLTLLAESLAVLALLGGRVRTAVLAVLATFHLSATLLLGVEFWGLMVCYAAFFDLEVGAERVRDALRRRRPAALLAR